MKLEGKVAIITGAADPKGLGAAIAKGFVDEGAKVVIADIVDGSEVVKSLEEAGGEALFVKTDVTDQEACFDMANDAAERFGTVHILVNCAAIFGDIVMKTLVDTSTEEFQKILNVNVLGPFHCVKAAFPYLQQNAGKVVNISSDVVDIGIPGFAHYTASKGGVWTLTRCMARELGMFNIRVNGVAPGLSMTGATQKLIQNAAVPIEGADEQIIQMRCLQRVQEAGDIVGTVLFLSSDYSEFVTGQLIRVNGGATFG
jgi:NAD(P)-dependent dehydrogenase (short-subunit alcohol dehydrogenase family)